jgi:hypothetical protein
MISLTVDGPGPIFNMDCGLFLNSCGPLGCVFMDPPDNLGLGYNGYEDKLPPAAYYGWLESLLVRAMKRSPIVWLSYYYKHDLVVSAIVERLLRDHFGAWKWRKILWRFTFGQYRDNDFTNGYRPMLLLTGHGARLHWDAIRLESERMRLGDPRAAGPRIPDDVWEIPRVTGNSHERRDWHPTQHPEALMERVLKLSVTGDQRFVDLFGGTGTTLRVSRRLGLNASVVELDPYYCKKMSEEIPSQKCVISKS